jgi:putative membrane protein
MDARSFLDADGAKKVDDAVVRAESRTSAEFVCVIATESGRYEGARALVGLVAALSGLAAADAVWSAASGPSSWPAFVPVAVQAAGVAGGFALGEFVAARARAMKRLFVSTREMEEEVARAAAAAFVRSRVATTKERTGVLVYVSLLERRIVVLFDEAARAAAKDGFASTLCASAVDGLKRGGRADVLVAFIDAVADELAPKLPPRGRAADELPNAVIVLHPR